MSGRSRRLPTRSTPIEILRSGRLRSARELVNAVAAIAAIAASSVAGQALAQATDYPNRAVRVIVAFTAGGTTDLLARAVSQRLSERFKQSFVARRRICRASCSASARG